MLLSVCGTLTTER